MDDVLAFRNAMAESGHEYTPAQAEKVVEATETFRQQIHDGCRENPEEYERLANLTLEDKQDICCQFAERGREVTLDELDKLIGLILEVHEEEKMF